MRLRWALTWAAAYVVLSVDSEEQVCDTFDDDLAASAQTSLLQTSLTVKHTAKAGKGSSQRSRWQPATPTGHERVKAGKGSSQRSRGQPATLTGHERVKAVVAHAAVLKTAHGSREEAMNRTLLVLGIGFFVLLAVVFCVLLTRQESGVSSTDDESGNEDLEVRKACGFDEDVYMMAIALIARDWSLLQKGVNNRGVPAARLVYSLMLLFITMGIQVALVLTTKAFVTPQQVASIRDSYDNFEQHMYAGHTRVLADTGKHRGNPGFFDISLFESFEEKGDVCQIPFSQLEFLSLVLLIWTITCIAQVRECTTYTYNLIIGLPTVTFMAHATRRKGNKSTIVGLTRTVKAAILFAILLPWLCVTLFLLYLGCRWLTATHSFGNLVSNGMALEFILQFKTVIFFAVTSERTKVDLSNTKYAAPEKYSSPSFLTYYNALLWGFAAVMWVYVYIFYVQSVLPEYQWDVHAPCTPYLEGALKH